MKSKIILFCAVVLCVSVFTGCPETPSFSDVAIEKTGYVLINYPDDWWLNYPTPALRYQFSLTFSGTVSADDFASIKIYLPDLYHYWTMDLEDFNNTTKRIIGLRFVNNNQEYAMPVGDFLFSAELNDGTLLTKKISMGVPGSVNSNRYLGVYNEDDLPEGQTFSPFWTTSLARPEVTAAAKTAQQISLTFKMHSANAYNGWIGLYNADAVCVGQSVLFRDKQRELFLTA